MEEKTELDKIKRREALFGINKNHFQTEDYENFLEILRKMHYQEKIAMASAIGINTNLDIPRLNNCLIDAFVRQHGKERKSVDASTVQKRKREILVASKPRAKRLEGMMSGTWSQEDEEEYQSQNKEEKTE